MALVVFCLSLAPARTRADESVTRVSEVTTPLDEAWHTPGYRLELQVGYESLPSWQTVPSGAGIQLGLGSGWQLTRAWSVDLTMSYLLFLATTGTLTGMRWAAAVGPTWHPWRGVRLGAAVGYANMLADWSTSPRNFTPATGFCDGPTARGVLHATYLLPLTEWFAMGPMLQAGLAYTKCNAIQPQSGPSQSTPGWPLYDVAATWVLSAR